jgi:hypothetical protein
VSTLASPMILNHRGAITTIDVLPMDVELWTSPNYGNSPEAIREGAESRLMSIAMSSIYERAYSLDTLIDWNGDGNGGGNVLDRDALAATVNTLAAYGTMASGQPGRIPIPHLPARLGTVTGADATLYVGGWAYVTPHHKSTGARVAEDIAIGILIAVAIVAVVVIVAAVAKGGGGGHGGGGGGGGGHGGGGGGGGGGGHGGAGAFSAGSHTGVGHGGSSGTVGGPSSGMRAGNGGSNPGIGGAGHGPGARGIGNDDPDPNLALRTIDAFGRIGDDIDVHPDYAGSPDAAHGEDSKMYLEMTLVDNHDGVVLWHAHQTFPADASSPDDVDRAARALFASMPPR